MKGITPVIAIILLLLITISMVGFAFIWFNRMMTTTTNETTRQTEEQLSQMGQKVSIDSTTASNIYVRNIGSVSIPVTRIAVYVNGAAVSCTWSGSIAPGAVSACGVGCASGGVARAVAPGNYDERACS
jgi:flagellin-like protein